MAKRSFPSFDFKKETGFKIMNADKSGKKEKAVNAIDIINEEVRKKEVPDFRVGDTLKVSIKVKEGDKTRTQLFEGICIRRSGSGASQNFTVVKESHGDIVEKIFPLYSPNLEKIKVEKKGKANRAKLYHLRKKQVKTA